MTVVIEDWRTDDMSLAAFLSLTLEQDPEIEWEMESCYFVFDKCDQLIDAVAGFLSDTVKVSPRQYNLEMAKMKKAIFSHPYAPKDRGWKRK